MGFLTLFVSGEGGGGQFRYFFIFLREDKEPDKFWGIWGIFRPNYQNPFWDSETLVLVFHYSTIISTKKLSLYNLHPKYLFGIGIWIWAAKIKDLAFICP